MRYILFYFLSKDKAYLYFKIEINIMKLINIKHNMNYPTDINEWRLIKVYGVDFRPDLLDMAQTITRLNLWDWMKNSDPPETQGYMWWQHRNVESISSGLKNNQHSGATFGYCMRQMQRIAKEGFQSWNRIPVSN